MIPLHTVVLRVITFLYMDGELILGMLIVAISLAFLTVLVFVSRARVERFHRDGTPSPRAVFRRRHGG